jgi:hypothetical protein
MSDSARKSPGRIIVAILQMRGLGISDGVE